ncbi:MAG: glycosyltransferase family 2 protein [Fibrobacteria bacterium]|nr:glycosyltransferase family 2 protein [Fibrobacteria bacterium]
MVVVTWQEEDNIGHCLDSVRDWADEMIVADMGSTDSTQQIAMSRGAKVMRIDRHPICEPGRIPPVRAARNDWILVLDADEQVSAGLVEEIRKAIADDTPSVFLVPRANLSLSGFAPHEAGFPEYTLRLFRRQSVDLDGYKGLIHTFFEPLPGVSIERLGASFPDCCLLHFTNPALTPFLEKINRYTSQDALTRIPWEQSGMRELLNPMRIFLRRYLKEKGWKDGWRGFWLCWISGVYEGFVLAKLWEMSLHEGAIPDSKMARAKMRMIVDGKP